METCSGCSVLFLADSWQLGVEERAGPLGSEGLGLSRSAVT